MMEGTKPLLLNEQGQSMIKGIIALILMLLEWDQFILNSGPSQAGV